MQITARRKERVQILAPLVLLLATPNALVGQNSGTSDQLFFQRMQEILDLASKTRATPITEPGIPTQQVAGDWKGRLLKLSETVLIATYQVGDQYKFYVQVSVCPGAHENSAWFDPTILGEHESATTFYAANAVFNGFKPDQTSLYHCYPPGVEIMATNSGLRDVSGTRALAHMWNWLLFLAKYKHDLPRSADFLVFTLDRYRRILEEANDHQMRDKVGDDIALFAHVFPFEVLDVEIPLDAEERSRVHESFQTLLFFCSQLAPLSHSAASLIPQVRDLVSRFE